MAEQETNENLQDPRDAVATEAPAVAPATPPPSPPRAHGGGPQEVLAPKERRRRARAARAAKAKPVMSSGPRTPEQRQEERVAVRRQKAEHRRVGRATAKAKASHGGATATPARERAPGVQKVRQGVVVSDRAAKTITVRIDTARRHRRYDKIVKTSRTLHAHDERNDAHIGDTVIVREARPLSATKRWRLVEVVQRAK